MGNTFGWLHLTDLHWGMSSQKGLWPRFGQKFFDDLNRLHDEFGPWDAVFFTGDLTQSGTEEQFDGVDALLEKLWNVFQKRGFHPSLLAVPGNHDLVRPAADNPEVILLGEWKERPEVQRRFWEDPASPYRTSVSRAFAPYQQWWDAQTLKPSRVNDGILPGDFSATIENSSGLRIGIVGLNTTFLQLTAGDHKGRL